MIGYGIMNKEMTSRFLLEQMKKSRNITHLQSRMLVFPTPLNRVAAIFRKISSDNQRHTDSGGEGGERNLIS